MEELKITSTRNTPEITLRPDGQLSVKGRSISENASAFYEPVEEWVKSYLKIPAKLTRIDINLEYCNSASAKALIHILQQLTYVSLKNKKFAINWFYEEDDDDIFERGQFFSSVLNAKFNFVKVK
jgi:SiaC family regulatory phosphoprotein